MEKVEGERELSALDLREGALGEPLGLLRAGGLNSRAF